MGKIACQYSDVAIVTSDNPRQESPEAIVDDIIVGIRADGIRELTPNTLVTDFETKGYVRQVDRRQALDLAIQISKPSDIIVAAGKGHETYQITRSGTAHFDDAEELVRACEKFETRFTPIEWCEKDLVQALAQDPAIDTLNKSGQSNEPGQPVIFSRINTDSRTITPTQIFLALKGETFDGHNFIPDLVEKGIQGFVAEKGYLAALKPVLAEKIKTKPVLFFEVTDTLNALGRLARYQRLRSHVKLIAITGSNGKTTTRKITQEIFKTRFHTLATQGNFNNEIGMPLTLLNLSWAHEWAVIEMGMNHPGEISRLAQIACPDIAIVTNTAGAHLEGLKTADNVARAKGEIFEHVQKNGHAILFADDKRRDILEACARKNKNIDEIIFFGSSPHKNLETKITPDIGAEKIEINGQTTHFTIEDKNGRVCYSIGSPAPFMVTNALAAIAAARIAGISSQGIRTGLEAFTPVAGRMKIDQLPNGINFIDDTYNANPASMTQALNTLGLMAREKKAFAILGDMLELGPDSDQLHRQIGHLAAEANLAHLYLFGEQTAHLMSGALERGFSKNSIFWGTKQEIGRLVMQQARKGDWILLKGSRGMAMETIISDMKNQVKKGGL
jgi:murE/murF fusion protein